MHLTIQSCHLSFSFSPLSAILAIAAEKVNIQKELTPPIALFSFRSTLRPILLYISLKSTSKEREREVREIKMDDKVMISDQRKAVK